MSFHCVTFSLSYNQHCSQQYFRFGSLIPELDQVTIGYHWIQKLIESSILWVPVILEPSITWKIKKNHSVPKICIRAELGHSKPPASGLRPPARASQGPSGPSLSEATHERLEGWTPVAISLKLGAPKKTPLWQYVLSRNYLELGSPAQARLLVDFHLPESGATVRTAASDALCAPAAAWLLPLLGMVFCPAHAW